MVYCFFFFFKQKTAYEMRISDWSSDVCSSDLYRGTQSLEATTSLTLPIELGGKRSARIAVADARTDRATIQATIAQADLRLNVIRAYAEAASAERRPITARDQARIATETLRAPPAIGKAPGRERECQSGEIPGG